MIIASYQEFQALFVKQLLYPHFLQEKLPSPHRMLK